jgi:hypothetical protein
MFALQQHTTAGSFNAKREEDMFEGRSVSRFLEQTLSPLRI